MENDYEIIFWYRTTTNKLPWVLMMFKKYQPILDGIAYKTSGRFYNTPFDSEDLKLFKYEVISSCMDLFDHKYTKSFKNFLVQRYQWHLTNEIIRFFNNRNKIINYCQPFNPTELVGVNNRCEIDTLVMKDSIVAKLNKLSSREKEIVELRLQNYSIKEIVNCTDFSYSQVDNTYQRAVRKLKDVLTITREVN